LVPENLAGWEVQDAGSELRLVEIDGSDSFRHKIAALVGDKSSNFVTL
jgi:hypothetical protein